MTATLARECLILDIGSEAVAFAVRRTARNALKIEVDPEGYVTVHAPHHATSAEIVARVNRKATWIQRQRKTVAAHGPASPARYFVSGESHLLLGVAYRLAVEAGPEAFARIDGLRLVVTARDPADAGHVRRVIEAFYRLKAREVFPARLISVMPPFARRGLKRPSLVVRRLQKRWGSYTAQGRVVLNVDLIRAAPSQIDYVLCHELAHALHPDHSRGWRELLTTVMPDWEQRKEILEAKLR